MNARNYYLVNILDWNGNLDTSVVVPGDSPRDALEHHLWGYFGMGFGPKPEWKPPHGLFFYEGHCIVNGLPQGQAHVRGPLTDDSPERQDEDWGHHWIRVGINLDLAQRWTFLFDACVPGDDAIHKVSGPEYERLADPSTYTLLDWLEDIGSGVGQ